MQLSEKFAASRIIMWLDEMERNNWRVVLLRVKVTFYKTCEFSDFRSDCWAFNKREEIKSKALSRN